MSSKKVIIVGSAVGRCGTSAMMGLIALSSLNIGGGRTKLKEGNAFNRKGFFEMRSINVFFKNTYKDYFSNNLVLPTIKTINRLSKKNAKKFEGLLIREFGEDFPIILKSGRCLAVPLLYHLNNYDVRVIIMQRNIKDQANSMYKMWKSSNKLRKLADKHFIIKRIRAWTTVVNQIKKQYNRFKYLTVDFYKLLENPLNISSKVYKFIGENKRLPPNSSILSWIDPKMVTK